jgi:hypothetical protein
VVLLDASVALHEGEDHRGSLCGPVVLAVSRTLLRTRSAPRARTRRRSIFDGLRTTVSTLTRPRKGTLTSPESTAIACKWLHCNAVGCESGRQDSNLRPLVPQTSPYFPIQAEFDLECFLREVVGITTNPRNLEMRGIASVPPVRDILRPIEDRAASQRNCVPSPPAQPPPNRRLMRRGVSRSAPVPAADRALRSNPLPSSRRRR